VEVVASLSQGRTAAAQCGLFTHKSVPVIFEPPCTCRLSAINCCSVNAVIFNIWRLFRNTGTPHATVKGRNLKIKADYRRVLCVSTSSYYTKLSQNVTLRTAIVSKRIAAVWCWFRTELIWRAIHVTWVFECSSDMPNNGPVISNIHDVQHCSKFACYSVCSFHEGNA